MQRWNGLRRPGQEEAPADSGDGPLGGAGLTLRAAKGCQETVTRAKTGAGLLGSARFKCTCPKIWILSTIRTVTQGWETQRARAAEVPLTGLAAFVSRAQTRKYEDFIPLQKRTLKRKPPAIVCSGNEEKGVTPNQKIAL